MSQNAFNSFANGESKLGATVSNIPTPGTLALAVAAATTIPAAFNAVVAASQAAAYAITIPAAASSKGCKINIFLTNAGANNVTVSSGANEIVGTIHQNGAGPAAGLVAAAAGTTLTFATGTARAGDSLELWSNGVSWFLKAVSSGVAGITIA